MIETSADALHHPKVVAATEENLQHAAQIVMAGGVIVAPSDTNLALTLDAWNEAAIERAFAIKRRPATSPLTLFLRHSEDWERYTRVPAADRATVQALAAAFWPGPFNLVLPRSDAVPDFLVRGGSMVALGVLSNPTLQRLLDFVGRPVAMTSANLSGRADGVLVDLKLASEQIGDAVDLILEGGHQGTTASSTIVKVQDGRATILRQGDVHPGAIRAALTGVSVATDL
ncbi:L-threonylcarbamoyladenylate synthase [Actinomyces ruminicola]|uniref:L-threonylcarbamoyladenylate synthase n=1 Tax=Actinomyces ruminicola TaxID=332524 RepID=A0A1G9WVV4_9ACTO|nr:L-threonylcarbamoyladenylate synthase [Actinomyces ruminicola]SDM88223.1 Telomere recombination [Actinomyces ruminicola]